MNPYLDHYITPSTCGMKVVSKPYLLINILIIKHIFQKTRFHIKMDLPSSDFRITSSSMDKGTLYGIIAVVTLTLLGIATMFIPFEHSSHAQTESRIPVGEIKADNVIGQTFISRYPNLYAISVFMATYQRVNRSMLQFRLKEKPDSPEPLREISVNASQIEDNQYYRFEFVPLAASRNRHLYFELSAPTASEGDAVTAWASLRDFYTDGSLIINGRVSDGDLRFSLHHRVRGYELLAVFLERAASQKPGILGNRWFYLFLLCTYGLVVLFVIFLTIRQLIS